MSERIFLDISFPYETDYLCLIGKIGEQLVWNLSSFSGDRETLAYHVNLVLTEAVANAIEHAADNRSSPFLHVTIRVENGLLTIRVFDQGPGFSLCDVQESCDDTLEEHGRGIFIIKSLMDRVSYIKLDDGHVLEMEKNLY